MPQFSISWSGKPWPFSWGPLNRHKFSVFCADERDAYVAVGLGFTSIPGLSSVDISTQVTVVFLPMWIVVPSRIADDFFITDIKVARHSQFVSPGAIPAALFSDKVDGVQLKMDVVPINEYITVSVTNRSQHARSFQGVVIGTTVRGRGRSSSG
jgi:hypothetical protein